MIRVLADTSHDAALIAEAVDGAVEVLRRGGPYTRDDDHVECLVLGCRSPVPPGRLELVRVLRQRFSYAPIILVTDPASDVARWLGESGVSDIVWFDNVKTELPPRIERLCRTAVLFGVAKEIERSTLPPALRSALAHSIRAATDQPVRSLTELSRVLHFAPGTLSRAFRTRVAGATTLSRFLGALVVLRAHQLRHSGLSWEIVSRQVGFTRPTLHLKSRKWPGRTLKELACIPRQPLLARFISDHVRPLLDGSAPVLRDVAYRELPGGGGQGSPDTRRSGWRAIW